MESLMLDMLPEECVAQILSLTSPKEACRATVLSSNFRSAADSDLVWERFLPSDYRNILSRGISDDGDPLQFSSKKHLFRRLCRPVFIDGGNKIFWLEKSTGKISYILSAQELSITWGNDPMYWIWKSRTDSRFSKVAELRTMCWLEIIGKIRTGMLSPNTNYGAYLIIKISNNAFGLDLLPSETSVQVGSSVTRGTVLLGHNSVVKQQLESIFYSNRAEILSSRVRRENEKELCKREDGWMEIELGEFSSGEDDEEVKMCLKEVKGYQLKGGLIVEGIELRPKY
ncbi:Phloem protein 2-like [Dillenia turbinata]|uniref:Phloem protein 2-like n=1 Tax=Dillenia turbinata TaxID=194707 RepID=A0AAN8UKC9_9MAGN